MVVTVLGACANHISNREGVALLVEKEASNLLIDCGPGIVSTLGKCNKRASDIDNVLLTHVHGDHIAGFPYFVWNRNFERMGSVPANDLNVFGPREAIELAQYTYEHCYPELKLPFEIKYHAYNEKESSFFVRGDLQITLVPAVHTVPCVSCVVQTNREKMVYTADSLYNERLLEHAMNVDLLVHEGMMPKEMSALAGRVKHAMAFEAGKFAREAMARQLLLVHIAPGMIGKECVLLEEAREEFSGPISIPCDGSVYII